jgi:hypothetical protein
MERLGDVWIIAEAASPGRGPLAGLYRSRWEAPERADSNPWRVRFASALSRLARALAPAPMERQRPEVADGAAS